MLVFQKRLVENKRTSVQTWDTSDRCDWRPPRGELREVRETHLQRRKSSSRNDGILTSAKKTWKEKKGSEQTKVEGRARKAKENKRRVR